MLAAAATLRARLFRLLSHRPQRTESSAKSCNPFGLILLSKPGPILPSAADFADLCTAGILLRTGSADATPLARLSLLYSSLNARAVA